MRATISPIFSWISQSRPELLAENRLYVVKLATFSSPVTLEAAASGKNDLDILKAEVRIKNQSDFQPIRRETKTPLPVLLYYVVLQVLVSERNS